MLELNKIYNMDCLDGMKLMDNDSVDLMITSPPYNFGKDYGEFKDNMKHDEYLDFVKSWMTEAYRVLKESSRAYIVLFDKLIFDYKKIAEEIGFTYVQTLVWCKPNLIKHTTYSGFDWAPMAEMILLLRKGKRISMLNNRTVNTFSFFVIPSPQSQWKGENKRYHIAQYPQKLVKMLILRTPCTTILDPFIGSGTTAVVSKQLNKNFIGFETEEKNINIANERLAKTQSIKNLKEVFG